MVELGSGEHTYETSGEDWGELPDGWTYHEATAVAVDSGDNVYVYNRGGHAVIVYDRDGKMLRSWGEGAFGSPHGIAIGPDDSIYCVDTGNHSVRKYTQDGKLLLTIGPDNDPAPAMSGRPYNRPTHVAVDPRNGDLYVADGYSNARVHKYDPTGRYLLSWGESGTDEGQFNVVHNIAVDNDGRVLVADRENRRIQIFDSNGNYVEQWVNLSKAAAICVDNNGGGLVYVGEYYAGGKSNTIGADLGPRVTIFDPGGNVVARLGRQSFGDEPGRFYSPHGVAVDSRGDIYVAEVSYSDYGRSMEPPRELRSLQKLVKKG